MIFLSYLGWFHGIYYIIHIIVSFIIGSIFIKKSKRRDVTLLLYAGLFISIGPLAGLPRIIEFFYIIFTGSNIDNPFGWLCILESIWFPIAIIFEIFIGSELLIPNKKWYIIITFSILGIIFELFVFFNFMGSVNFIYPEIQGDYFIISTFQGFPYIIKRIFFIFLIIFNGFGVLVKSFEYKGVLKTKFISLSISFMLPPIIFLIPMPLDIMINIAIVSQMFIYFLVYYGLTEPKIKKTTKVTEKKEKLISFLAGKTLDVEKITESEPLSEITTNYVKAFISYCIDDSCKYDIEEIAKELTSFEEIENVLYCERDTSDDFIEYMDENLGKCHILILFCSPKALNSEYVKNEWRAIRAMEKPIIPVFMKKQHIPPLLRSRLGVQFEPFNLQKNVKKIHDIILKKLKAYYSTINLNA